MLIGGTTVTIKVAHMRLCHSRMPFVRAYPRETQEMVFDAHDKGFAFFKGACTRGIYDNMKTAVDAIFVGKERAYNRRFAQMCGHYLVGPVACTPASGWEKGQVENQAQRLRRRQDDHRPPRPPDSPLRHRRDRQRKLAVQKPRLMPSAVPDGPDRLRYGRATTRQARLSPPLQGSLLRADRGSRLNAVWHLRQTTSQNTRPAAAEHGPRGASGSSVRDALPAFAQKAYAQLPRGLPCPLPDCTSEVAGVAVTEHPCDLALGKILLHQKLNRFLPPVPFEQLALRWSSSPEAQAVKV